MDHFRGLLRMTPTHGFSEPIQLNIFIDGPRPHSKQLLDDSASEKIKLNTPDEAMELIENMATSDHAILCDRAYSPVKKSLLELTSQDALLVQNKLLAKQIGTLKEALNKLPQQLHSVQPASSSMMQVGGCTLCGGAHESSMCMTQENASKEVNYMVNPNHQGYHHVGELWLSSGRQFLLKSRPRLEVPSWKQLQQRPGGSSNRP